MKQDEVKKITGEILERVQMEHVFPDGKTFVDCIPRFTQEEICSKYNKANKGNGFNLREFILQNYYLPEPVTGYKRAEPVSSVTENIESLWDILTREPVATGGSLIELPYPYIVPGGRFGEIYYWDSYFTMLGLQVSGKLGMIENMIKNFSYLINRFGYIPNGNRTYFLGRSQPPFYSLMIRLLATEKGDKIILKYLEFLEKEYNFWMKGFDQLGLDNTCQARVVLLPDGELLNRYWDENETPRPESYREDVELAGKEKLDKKKLFKDLRAGAESGWDFSGRWFNEKKIFSSIHTTDLIPVDLNCLLVHMEEILSEGYDLKNDTETAMKYKRAAAKRIAAIQKYCWNGEKGFYFDYDFKAGRCKTVYSLAAVFPLYFKISTTDQATSVALHIEQKFLQAGGLLTSLEYTGQQWDAPNGWAPLHWIAISGLENYRFYTLSKAISGRWIKLCTDVFHRTGKLMEKYNVVDTHLEAGGGEYPGQDGFGWTNGVLLALIKKRDH